ncbi:MAG: CpsD/CapB family tyrosine-protein kinase [Clostridia bacterium]|nr:CpsD/CapB family tyrosine-protein kinase [Clostridia bacterium]
MFKIIRTNLEFTALDKKFSSLVVTSATPAEGKSTILANLAAAFAQCAKKVLIVDCDLRKPTQHEIFGLPNSPGLTNILLNNTSRAETIKPSYCLSCSCSPTFIKNLFLLPSGPLPPDPTELIASGIIKDLTGQLQSSYDLLLFDSPPVSIFADTAILANFLDGVILVINSGEVKKETAVKAKASLLKAKAKILGVVLNNMETGRNHSGGTN